MKLKSLDVGNHNNLHSCLLPNQLRLARPSLPLHYHPQKCRMHVLAYAMQQEEIPVPPVASIALIYIACTHAL